MSKALPNERELASGLHDEWKTLFGAAMLGTDRRALTAGTNGWDAWCYNADPAIQLLDRVAAVTVARRAGAQPEPAPQAAPPAPPDSRPQVSAISGQFLARMLRGEHDLLLPEWFAQCAVLGQRLPAALVPALLRRGRRNPHFDRAVRELAGPRAQWLIESMPELGLRAEPAAVSPDAAPFIPVAAATDSAAVVTAVVSTFGDGAASWAVAPQLRLAVASISASWLPALVTDLQRLRFNATSERTRVELLVLAHFRIDMLAALATLP